jgi:hypothetical protein
VFLPSIPTLFFRSTRNQRCNCGPILATVHLHRIHQLPVSVFCPFTPLSRRRSDDAGIQGILPSTPALFFRSIWKQRRNFLPILATVRFYCILQRGVFVWCPATFASTCSVDAGIQAINPSTMTLYTRSTRNQRGNCGPILATVRFYCILQRVVFVFSPATLASTCSVDAGIQAIVPSIPTLLFRSAWNQGGNCIPIIATVRLNRILQLAFFDCCPVTRSPTSSANVGN